MPFAASTEANDTFVPNLGACQTAAGSSARVQLFSNSRPERWKSCVTGQRRSVSEISVANCSVAVS